MASKTQLIGGNFQDSEGNVLANGYLKFKLNQDEIVTGSGQICSGIEVTIALNSSGSIDTVVPQLIWGNDQMIPVNSYYRVKGYSSRGQLAWGPNNQQVLGSGGTFDVGTWTPNTVFSWAPPLQSLEVEVEGTPTSNQSLLNFTSTDNSVTITNPSGGDVDFSVPTSSSVSISDLYENLHGFSVTPGLGSGFPATGMTLFSAASVIQAAPTATDLASYRPTGSGGVYFVDTTNGLTLGSVNRMWTKYALSRTLLTRNWVGFAPTADVQAAVLASNTPVTTLLGFRYSTDLSADNHWKCYASPNGSAVTLVDTGVVPDTAFHKFEIDMTAGVATFYIDGILVGTISTNVPSLSVPMTPVLYGEPTDATPSYFGVGYMWYTGN